MIRRNRLIMPKKVASKEDWIKLGFDLFAESGEKGLIVDKMSTTLKCNKSSFYWHFKTRAHFIEELIQYWIQKDTQEIINQLNTQQSPKEQFIQLIRLAFEKDSRLDFVFYLKKYAQSKPKVQKIIDQIDEDRMAFVSKLLKGMGYSPTEAEIKAQVFYKYLIGYHEMIRYKQQFPSYLEEVIQELNQFIQFS